MLAGSFCRLKLALCVHCAFRSRTEMQVADRLSGLPVRIPQKVAVQIDGDRDGLRDARPPDESIPNRFQIARLPSISAEMPQLRRWAMSDAKETQPETVSGEPLDTKPEGPEIEENDPTKQKQPEQDYGLLIDRGDEPQE